MPDFPTQFDTVFHILGGQNIPNYMGIRQFEAGEHIFIYTQETQRQMEVLREACNGAANVGEPILIKPYAIAQALDSIKDATSERKLGSIACNCTGGTKHMYDAVRQFCAARDGFPFYIETRSRVLHGLGDASLRQPMKPAFEKVSDFFKLIPDRTCNPAITAKTQLDRKNLTTLLWENRTQLGSVYFKFSNQREIEFQENLPLNLITGKGQASFRLEASGWATVNLPSHPKFTFQAPDLASYLAGGWLEEYCHTLLDDSTDRKKIVDLVLRTTIHENGKTDPLQEIDLAFTDGHVLTLCECKAGGNIEQKDFQKLENIADAFGGSHGRGLLLCAQDQPTANNIQERVTHSRQVSAFVNRGLQETFASSALSVGVRKYINL